MLQQTQVKTVIPYFIRFIKNFPNLKLLAKSHEQKILKNWEGLGYYSRAKNLKKTAQILKKNFQGKLPNNFEDLISFESTANISYKKGDIIFFPSHTLHGVTSHQSDDIRKTLSVNFKIDKVK